MRHEQHLRTFLKILELYPADSPVGKFLPAYFRQNKQMGGADRRSASRLLYTYFRLGRACDALPPEERLFLAEFLCNTDSAFLAHFKPALYEKAGLPLRGKIGWLETQDYGFKLADVFPFHTHLSRGIDREAFLASFFIQPDLFIRIHPGKEKKVKAVLDSAAITYSEEAPGTLRLENGTKLDPLFADSRDFEVQDLSSQQTGAWFKPAAHDYWWDACAASGGKSLLLFNQEPSIKLLVSDIRESVLANLDERFARSGLTKYHKKLLDLTQDPQPVLHDYHFDGILLDAPCSGSGTWGRTPEMLSQFRETGIRGFHGLQESILNNVTKYLKPGKPLVYITCSVFKEENEDMVDFISTTLGLSTESCQVIKGYEKKADTMFVARFVR
ncbi:RsmB/NOP family class I SAM-dependent RNA methyltransferase [Pedobacter sp. HMF7056]|uniref:RsmB/NOP family class I SAM-dependent RNA methyltransferase n=2 Tax=Hufsiella ginkgonis TaxID=2695274 RepID=A0A7K1XZT8_9SPHI|nr:RsmB/NOP family class I SAM-dependent RNA methyltransferase [Hufsiella ginkgonis]